MATGGQHQIEDGLRFRHFFGLAIGSVIGVGWIAVAPEWVRQAGLIGASVAFLAAAILLLPVGLAYAQLAHRYPDNGGAIVYAEKELGVLPAYLAGHLVLLSFLSAIMYFAILMPQLLADTLPLGLLADDSGHGGWGIVIAVTLALAVVNHRGSRFAAGAQNLALAFLVLGCLTFTIYGLRFGSFTLALEQSLSRPFEWGGFLAVFMVAPWFLSGFESVAQVVGDRDRSMDARRIAQVIAGALAGASTFYVLIIAATAALDASAASAGPSVSLIALLSGSPVTAIVVLTGILGILTSWNAFLVASLRTLETMAEKRFLPALFAKPEKGGGSKAALLLVSIPPFLGLGLGSDRLDPVLEAGALCVVALFFVVAVCFARSTWRHSDPLSADRLQERATAVLAVVVTAVFAITVAVLPIAAAGELPAQWFALIALLAAALGYYAVTRSMRCDRKADAGIQ